MRKLKNNIRALLLPAALLAMSTLHAQTDSTPTVEVVKFHYYNVDNNIQYILIESLYKTGKKTKPDPRKAFQLYLDSNRAENLISKLVTDDNGKAKSVIPPGLKATWDAAPTHKFVVVAEASGKEEETTTEYDITKAKITMDTATEDGVRNITVKVMAKGKDNWAPAKDVEMKIGVSRLGGILSAGDEETYTTDSTGSAKVEFKKDSLPGDINGNFQLMAKVDDNDQFGNLMISKTVPWGTSIKPEKDFFNQRTLWSTRFKTPYWLLFMAYSIVIGVWGTIIYLVFQIVKIKKVAAEAS